MGRYMISVKGLPVTTPNIPVLRQEILRIQYRYISLFMKIIFKERTFYSRLREKRRLQQGSFCGFCSFLITEVIVAVTILIEETED